MSENDQKDKRRETVRSDDIERPLNKFFWLREAGLDNLLHASANGDTIRGNRKRKKLRNGGAA